MEMQKKTPSSFETKGNNSSQPLDKGAMGVAFTGVQIEQRQTGKGNVNTMSPVSGGEK